MQYLMLFYHSLLKKATEFDVVKGDWQEERREQKRGNGRLLIRRSFIISSPNDTGSEHFRSGEPSSSPYDKGEVLA